MYKSILSTFSLALSVLVLSTANAQEARPPIDLKADRIECTSGDSRDIIVAIEKDREKPIYLGYLQLDWTLDNRHHSEKIQNDCQIEGDYLHCRAVSLTIDLRNGMAKKLWTLYPSTTLYCRSEMDTYHYDKNGNLLDGWDPRYYTPRK